MKALWILVWMLAVSWAAAQNKKLQQKLEQMMSGFEGEIGLYVKNLRTGRTISINADSIFPTASMIKIPIMLGVLSKVQSGEMRYAEELVYKDSLLYEGVDILGSFKTGEKIEMGKVMMLMLTMSDNTASLWLQSLAGGGARINELLDSLGFRLTRVNSRTPGREQFRSMYGWGQTTPREMATLMEKIYDGSILSPSLRIDALRMLSRNYWHQQAISQIPPTTMVFSKNGAVDESRSEVLLVLAKKNPFVFCICTKNNKDQSWTDQNEAWQLTRKISATLWSYFND